VYVRCSVRNGRDHAAFISAVSRTLSGYGKPFLDPYAYVSGGLYDASNVPMTNGNERGVATLRGEESPVGFRDLDFGPYGSDTFAIDLFPLESDPFTFEVWEGMPPEGGRKIADLPYDLGSVWNTYQEARYALPVRLNGVTTLCFVFRRKVHIRGFRFERLWKAFRRLVAAECDALYGDRYRRADGRVEDIGNNVTLTYRDMDFGTGGADRVTLCWRSTLDRNAVQVLFAGETGESRQTVSLGRREDYGEETLPLREQLYGKGELSLLFLPGCSLDLAWLRFEKTDGEPPKP
jgi:beta-galactosidase